MKQAMINYIKNGSSDELYTPNYAITPLLKYIPSSVKTIWCPCDTISSNIVKTLAASGYDVIFSHIKDRKDFLIWEPDEQYDMIITNPPYSIKDSIIKRCYELGKPFALLLPITALEGVSRGNMYREGGVGVIVFDKRVEFMQGSCWFNTGWFVHSNNTDNKLFFERLEK